MKIAKKKKTISKVQRQAKVSSGLFLAPSFLGVLLFFVLPFTVVIFYSVVDNPISHNFVFFDCGGCDKIFSKGRNVHNCNWRSDWRKYIYITCLSHKHWRHHLWHWQHCLHPVFVLPFADARKLRQEKYACGALHGAVLNFFHGVFVLYGQPFARGIFKRAYDELFVISFQHHCHLLRGMGDDLALWQIQACRAEYLS